MKNTLLLILLLGLVCRVAFAQEDEDPQQEQQEEQAADEQDGDSQEPAEDGEEESVDAIARQKRSAEAGYVGTYGPKKVFWEDKVFHDAEAAIMKDRKTKYTDDKLVKKAANRYAAKDLYYRDPKQKLREKALAKNRKYRKFQYHAQRYPYYKRNIYRNNKYRPYQNKKYVPYVNNRYVKPYRAY